MEHFVSLEVWAVLVAAPCVIAWFLGDLHGAARVTRMVEAGDLENLSQSGRSSVASRREIEAAVTPASGSPKSDSREIKPISKEYGTGLSRFRETESVWADLDPQDGQQVVSPISERVLQHYRGSISELGRRNALAAIRSDGPLDRSGT